MISFDEAIRLIAAQADLLGSEQVALGEAAGRVLVKPLLARSASPRVAVATMDGYAVTDSATRPGEPIKVIGTSWAGAGYSGTVANGQAVRIFTGAPLPRGADRCIMQEYAIRDGDEVRFAIGYGPDWHVRAAGSDFAAGDILLDAGTRLTPRAMVAAAAADSANLAVAVRPRVVIIGTGDELAPPGEAFRQDHAIPESATFGVSAMAQQAGAKVIARMIEADDLGNLEVLARNALTIADLVIVIGGASVGERDFAKSMFAAHGLKLAFSKVAVKPGKPVWLGRTGQSWVLGLPGNPTSAMVTARLFLMPLLALLQGQPSGDVLRWRKLPLAAPLGATGNRETFVRASWHEAGLVPIGNQDSGAQSALPDADWLIRCPAGHAALEIGQVVNALSF